MLVSTHAKAVTHTFRAGVYLYFNVCECLFLHTDAVRRLFLLCVGIHDLALSWMNELTSMECHEAIKHIQNMQIKIKKSWWLHQKQTNCGLIGFYTVNQSASTCIYIYMYFLWCFWDITHISHFKYKELFKDVLNMDYTSFKGCFLSVYTLWKSLTCYYLQHGKKKKKSAEHCLISVYSSGIHTILAENPTTHPHTLASSCPASWPSWMRHWNVYRRKWESKIGISLPWPVTYHIQSSLHSQASLQES